MIVGKAMESMKQNVNKLVGSVKLLSMVFHFLSLLLLSRNLVKAW